MKLGVILFHKNINDLYPSKWISKCLSSIRNQTYNNFTFYEINYGGDGYQLVEDSVFYNIEKKNYADAMNFIITEAFNDGCDYVFNTNLDDFYHNLRIEKQLEYLNMGFDIVSSDFCYVDADDNITLYMNITTHGDIKYNLNINHNIIAHPCVAINKTFWIDPLNRYDIEKTPSEDLHLWRESINREYKFHIHKDVLLYYRIHNNQVSNKK
jgi:hypothetical protein